MKGEIKLKNQAADVIALIIANYKSLENYYKIVYRIYSDFSDEVNRDPLSPLLVHLNRKLIGMRGELKLFGAVKPEKIFDTIESDYFEMIDALQTNSFIEEFLNCNEDFKVFCENIKNGFTRMV